MDLNTLLGFGVAPKDLTTLQVVLRGLVVFWAALIMVRIADKRFMAKLSAFDVILGFVLASLLARAINGSGPLVPTLATGLALVLLHRALSKITCWSPALERLVKGNACVIVRDGQADQRKMFQHAVSADDLDEEVRLNGNLEDICGVRLAMLERNGKISIVKKD